MGLLLFSANVYAHEAEGAKQFPNLADADWLSPIIALLIIIIAIFISRKIKK